MSKNKTIETLNLNINALSDACLPMVIELIKSNPNLKKIYLGQNNISARKAKDFVKLVKDEYKVTLII